MTNEQDRQAAEPTEADRAATDRMIAECFRGDRLHSESVAVHFAQHREAERARFDALLESVRGFLAVEGDVANGRAPSLGDYTDALQDLAATYAAIAATPNQGTNP